MASNPAAVAATYPDPASQSESRMRVVLCIDSLNVGGTELNVVRTAELLPRFGIDVVVLVFRADGSLTPRCERSGVMVVPFPIPSLWSPKALPRAYRLSRVFRDLRADLVHAHDRYSNAFAVPSARLARIPALASRRWWDVHPSRALGLANRFSYRLLAQGVVANSSRVAALVEQGDGVPHYRVHVIPNFLDESSLTEAPANGQAALRRELGLPGDAVVVGCVANLRAVKDHRTLFEAMRRVLASHSNTVLCLVGDGELRKDLQRLAGDLGIADRVAWAGSRTDQVNWHRAFDISVLTSRSEGFPNTVIEAMAAGRPVVATGVGGTADAVLDGETGLLVRPGDADAVTGALERLIQDANTRETMGLAGRRLALTRYSADAVLPTLVDLYRRTARIGAGGEHRAPVPS